MATKKHKPTVTGIAQGLATLPADKRRVALEMSAALAGVSLRVSRAFVEAVPEASDALTADDIRVWAEFGRRLAMGSAETAAGFFADAAVSLREISSEARHHFFQLGTRQLVLSSSTALDSYRLIPDLVRAADNDRLLTDILSLAADVAARSARHSADLLAASPGVISMLRGYDDAALSAAVFTLARDFAHRTGGLTAELWQALPDAFNGLAPEAAILLAGRTGSFLEFGGSVALHFIRAGNRVVAVAPAAFEAWAALAEAIAPNGNAVLISFLRSTPAFVSRVATGRQPLSLDDLRLVLGLTARIAAVDAEAALAAFRSSCDALSRVSISQFEAWVEQGLSAGLDSPKARRSFFALETRDSNDRLSRTRTGLALDSIQQVLRLYVEALTGREVEIAPLTAVPQGARIGDGRVIYLPKAIAEFSDDDKDFRLYKVLAAHGAGQIEFGTFERDTPGLTAAFRELSDLYSATADHLDAFSLAGYIEDVQTGETALPHSETLAAMNARARTLPDDSDYKAVLSVFPDVRLARRIFGTMENARIDRRLRRAYRGLGKDLDLMRDFLRSARPYIFDVPADQVPFELLFQITLCGGATDDARRFYGPAVSEIETVVERYLTDRDAAVSDSLMATSRVYSLFRNISPEHMQESAAEEPSEKGEFAYDDRESAEPTTDETTPSERRRAEDIRDLFNAWNSLDDEGEPDDLSGAETWSHSELGEQALEPDDVAFAYDEWDRELNDYRVGWNRVVEKKVKQGDRGFVELTRSRYRGVISSIRHQFQLMKPENLTKVNRELDGEDYDLNALVDFVIDRRADGLQSENIYTKRLRKQRDVAVSFLLDQSSSTARTITRNPLQPYTHPGRRIIEIEKEGLVLMSEALEAVGDVYSINGFTSEGRRNVKFYVVKDFDEQYSEETERRIGGITFQNNTRLGAAIRHAAHKLLRQDSRTRLLIILTDGRPYDHDYGDARYAREDVREALIEAKSHGITPFCITIDRESEAELRDLYGDVGYTIIDDVLTLPERMPHIYRRLTT